MSKNTFSFPDPDDVPEDEIANPEPVLMPLDALEPDPEYQRALISSHVNSMAANFDQRLTGLPTVVHRPSGKFVIIDGQQRIEAARKAGYRYIRVNLIELHTQGDEARLFVRINTAARSLTPQDLFRACLVMKTNVARCIEATLSSKGRGLTALPTGDKERRKYEITAVAKLLEAWGDSTPVYRNFDRSNTIEQRQYKNGERALEKAIEAGMPLIQRNFPAKKVYQGSILGALIWMFRTNDNLSVSKVKSVIRSAGTPEQLRFEITKTETSTGGSRRDLYGVRLAYWVNTNAAKPFVTLKPEAWLLLHKHDGVDVLNDPAVLVAPSELSLADLLGVVQFPTKDNHDNDAGDDGDDDPTTPGDGDDQIAA